MSPAIVPAGAEPIHETASICCYCGTGCGVRIRSQGQQVLGVSGDPQHPSSRGALCSKGRELAATVRHDHSRILRAQWRSEKSAQRHDIPLQDACDIAAGKLAETIIMHGPDAIGFYLSGQLLTEDYAVFNKLARALVGTNNIDTNSRLCMSSAVSGYTRTLGADAPPACYDDLDQADTVLIAGSNMAYAHPVLFQRLAQARARRPAMKIIVIDPRRTDTCDIADLHLPISPGSDVALFHAMLNVMVWEDLIDRDYIARHTDGFAELKQRIHEFTPQAAQDVCGVPAADIAQCARWFGQAGAALSLYTMGLNQSSSGTAKNAALIHLHLATGQIGRPGTGPFSLTGQPNAMGGREAGGMATLLPGHRSPGNADHRAEVAELWRVDALPDTPGHTAVDMFDAVLKGDVKVLWIAATNPAQSLPEQSRVRAALQKAELVIVQEAFANTETLAYADLILPAATWPEKDGTVTNSERRISRVRAAIAPPGEAQPDWKIVCSIARKLAERIAPAKAGLFDYPDEAGIFAEHARSTAGRDLDYSALDYAVLQAHGPQQWPFRAPTQASTRLYADGVFPTATGRARFMDVGYVPVAENISAHYPLRLTTGRMRDQWHTLSRSGLAPALSRHVEEPFVYLHPGDMRRYKIVNDALVRVRTKRGAIVLPAMGDDSLKPGHAFLYMHWGSAYMAGDGVNALASRVRDPISHQPELKHSAAGIDVLKYAWHASAWVQGDAAQWRPRLAPWLKRFPYAVLVPSALGGHSVR
ncbi:MAG: nitrate reductase, partial [Pusillimonas sp.]